MAATGVDGAGSQSLARVIKLDMLASTYITVKRSKIERKRAREIFSRGNEKIANFYRCFCGLGSKNLI